MIPQKLNQKIEQSFRRISSISSKAEEYNGTQDLIKMGFSTLKKIPIEKMRPIVTLAIQRWAAGQKTRVNNMVITWKQLSEPGYISKHSKDAGRRKQDMAAVFFALVDLWKSENAFPGCLNIEVTPSGMEIHLVPEKSSARNPVKMSQPPHETP